MIAAALIITFITCFVNQILFYLEVILAKILDVLYQTFELFSGIEPVTYSGTKTALINVFISNNLVSTLYKGMALIGIAMTFAFAIAAVIKKSFDSTGEKVKATYGMILGNVLKAILLICLMTAIVTATVDASGRLLKQIDYLFDNVEELSDPSTIYFDDQDYASMFRIMDTIGNYTLNPTYNNRFNINACFNAIRTDFQVLESTGMFNFTYDATEEAKNSWQAALVKIYNAADVDQDLPIDVYNETLTKAMVSCVEKLQQDASFKPLSSYYRGYTKTTENFSLGKTMMVASSLDAAINSKYNKNPEIYDNLRRAYMTGDKNIYSWSQVNSDFIVDFGYWHHAVATIATWMFIKEFIKILINCVARIFNIILLYITAPPFIAVMPLDDGGKVKQWTTAFIVQTLSIFGSIIAVRLAIVFIPIILSSNLVIFADSTIKNLFAKIAMVIAIIATSEKASGMITGILTDNAGYQSVMAGDVGSGLMQRGAAFAGRALGAAMTVGKAAGGLAMKEMKVGGKAIGDATGLSKKVGDFTGGIKNKFQSMRDKGGFKAAKASGWKTNEGEKAEKSEKADSAFKSSVLEKLGNLGMTPEQKQKAEKTAEKKKKDDKSASLRGSQSKDDAVQQGKNAKKLGPHGMKINPLDGKKGLKDDFNIGSKSKLSLAPPPELGRQKPKPIGKSSSSSKKKESKPVEKPKTPVRASNEEAEKNGRKRSNAVYKKGGKK